MAKLIEKGWDPLLKDKEGRTPADYAKMCKPAPVDVELARCEEVKGGYSMALNWFLSDFFQNKVDSGRVTLPFSVTFFVPLPTEMSQVKGVRSKVDRGIVICYISSS